MNIAIINFTRRGGSLNRIINEGLSSNHKCTSYTISKYAKDLGFNDINGTLAKWTNEIFNKVDGIIFIGATGIAVRAIAPCIKSKDIDPAVIVLDEGGKFVVPILSGHIGGGNELALEISDVINGTPVITTATDVNSKFAVDNFAKKKGLVIDDIKMIKEISGRILNGEIVGLKSDYNIDGDLPEGIKLIENVDAGILISTRIMNPFKYTINLIPKVLVLGIGCRKNTEFKNIEELVLEVLICNNISIKAIKKIASIDLKKDEQGIIEFCNKYNIPFETYSAEELNSLEGEFTESAFVSKITGVNNVCERASVYGSNNSKILVKKYAKNGVTVAIAEEEWSVDFE